MGPGDKVGGRYRIVEHIGAGGMGDVWKAIDEELDEPIALKMLATDARPDAAAWLERFRGEVKLARRVTHKNVARIFDIGTVGDLHYLTMELVEGESLRRRMRQPPSISLFDAVVIARDLARGIAAVHEAGVVHGDVKPGNVMLRAGGDASHPGRVVLIDFGLARSVDHGKDVVDDQMAGTLAYMAPEQLRSGEVVGPAVDVYALGLVLFELVAQEPPFVGHTGEERAQARLHFDAPSLKSYRHNIPDALADVVAQCLHRDPSRRPPAAEVAAILDTVQASDAIGTEPEIEPFLEEPTAIVHAPVARGHGLAVLPFASNDPKLADGLTDALRELLALTNGLVVVTTQKARMHGAHAPDGHTTSHVDAAPGKPPRPMGAARAAGIELGVDVVVAGVVDVNERGVAIRYRLVDVDTGRILLADQVEGGVADLLRLQERAARRIAERLRVQLSTEAYRDVVPAEAVEIWLKTRSKLRLGPGTDPAGAYDELDRALTIAPRFLLAHAGRAVGAARCCLAPIDPKRDWQPLARAAVADALAIASDVPDTHYAAALLAEVDSRYGDMVAALERALRLAPSYADAHELLGRIEMESGRVSDGSRRLLLAAELDPGFAGALTLVVRAAVFRGRDDVAARVMRRVERGPKLSFELLLLRCRIAVWKDEKPSDVVRQRLPEVTIQPAQRLIAAGLAAAEGNVMPLLEMRASFEKVAPHARYLSFLHQLSAEVLARRDPQAALEHVEGADWHGLFDLDWLDRCPSFAGIRTEPRFVHVRDRVARRVLRPQ